MNADELGREWELGATATVNWFAKSHENLIEVNSFIQYNFCSDNFLYFYPFVARKRKRACGNGNTPPNNLAIPGALLQQTWHHDSVLWECLRRRMGAMVVYGVVESASANIFELLCGWQAAWATSTNLCFSNRSVSKNEEWRKDTQKWDATYDSHRHNKYKMFFFPFPFALRVHFTLW